MSDQTLDQPTLAEIALALKPAELSQAQRARLRERVFASVTPRLPAGLSTTRAGAAEWTQISPLVQLKVLRIDAQAGHRIVLIRAAAGGTLPAHRHTRDEEFIVLEGECHIGTLHLVAGDAHFAAAGSCHEDITTDTGVLVLLRGEFPPPAHT